MEHTSVASPGPQSQTPTKSLNHYSCALCYQRKVKCDKENPCTYCVKHQVPCMPASTEPPPTRKNRFPETELVRRLRKYEAALKNNGADIDAILNSEESTDSTPNGCGSAYAASPETEKDAATPSRHDDSIIKGRYSRITMIYLRTRAAHCYLNPRKYQIFKSFIQRQRKFPTCGRPFSIMSIHC
jgi:hypothetical protein